MDPSINIIKASDGSGNASLATVQSIRSALATTIDVNTVSGIPAYFCGSMGTPHTFTDPVTSETITVISEATAVDFRGHVDGSNLEIDEIAPGYTDAGSAVGDIVVIRPTTQWSDNVAEVLGVSLNDDGSLKAIVETSSWIPNALPAQSGTIVNNGNRSYNIPFASTVADILTPGMRVRTSRTVAAPTQCADLEAGSSQYFNDTSVSGMTFTDDFVVSAWIKLESYTQGAIASRYNGTSGWLYYVDASGKVNLTGYNAGAANYSLVSSYQSLPLNKWVHVSAQLDMSTFTATTTTSYIMFDGVDVPAAVTRGGTNPTALIQAGDLNIGASNSSGNYFDGKIAQVAIYSAKVTQANIRATISQGLSGSETSLVSAYSFNNSINDLNANANNLTAQGSAVATNADSPFTVDANGVVGGTYDFGIVTKVATTTATVQVPEGCAIPTSGGVSAVDLSSVKSPFGFPAAKNRWRIESLVKTSTSVSISGINTWIASFYNLTVPIGDWFLGYDATVIFNSTVAGTRSGYLVFETSTPTNAVTTYESISRIYNAASAANHVASVSKHRPISLSAQTVCTPYAAIDSSTGTETWYFLGAQATTILVAEPAHL